MFNMSDLSISLYLTEKSYTFLSEDTFFDSVPPNPLDMLHKENWIGKLTFLM